MTTWNLFQDIKHSDLRRRHQGLNAAFISQKKVLVGAVACWLCCWEWAGFLSSSVMTAGLVFPRELWVFGGCPRDGQAGGANQEGGDPKRNRSVKVLVQKHDRFRFHLSAPCPPRFCKGLKTCQ